MLQQFFIGQKHMQVQGAPPHAHTVWAPGTPQALGTSPRQPCGAQGRLPGTESPTATSWVRDASPLLCYRAGRAANPLYAKPQAVLENRTRRNLKVPGWEEGGKPTHSRARGIMNESGLSLPVSIPAPQVDWEERMLPHQAGVWLQSLDGVESTKTHCQQPRTCSYLPCLTNVNRSTP